MSKRADRIATAPVAGPALGDVEDIADARFRLQVDDLVPGENGEVVLFNDSALREVVIVSPDEPVDEGTAAAHRTAEGVDVDGYRFIRFNNGVVLYHDPDTAVTIETP
jgi:hypothetical protein